MSETTYLKLKKHDNPSTNEEAFDVENYLNSNWDKIEDNALKVNDEILKIKEKDVEQDDSITEIQQTLENKVDKIDGKELSSNDFTDEYKNKLESLENYNDSEVKEEVSNIKEKDTEQENKIIELQKDKEALETEVKELQKDVYRVSLRGQASGEYIHVEDSSNARSTIGINGSSKQETRSGKNYLNTLAKYKAGETVTIEGITYTFNEDGSITCNGTATEDSFLEFSPNLQIINGLNKKLVGRITGTQVPTKLCILAYTSDWSATETVIISDVNKYITVNIKDNDYAIFRIITYKGTTLNNQTIYCQILDISVTDLTYEQYGVMPSPDYQSKIQTVGSNGSIKVTKCNKNLFEKDNITLSENSYNLDDNGELIFQGSWRVVNYIKVKPNTTYTLSGVMIPNKWTHRISEYDAQLVHIKQNQKTFDGFHTFTTSSTTKYIRFDLVSGNNGFDYDLSSIQLEESSTATEYEQHEEQAYIMPTQSEMLEGDYFDYDNEEEVHVWEKIIFTGEEDWRVESQGRFGIAKAVLPKEPIIPSDNYKYLGNMCNYYKEETPLKTWNKAQGFCIDMSSNLRIYDNTYSPNSDVDGFKAWLKSKYDAGTPITVYYQLATPTRLVFTDEQKAVAKELNNARTYKNITNIYSTDEVSPIIDLDYAKDLETVINNVQALAIASEGV